MNSRSLILVPMVLLPPIDEAFLLCSRQEGRYAAPILNFLWFHWQERKLHKERLLSMARKKPGAWFIYPVQALLLCNSDREHEVPIEQYLPVLG